VRIELPVEALQVALRPPPYTLRDFTTISSDGESPQLRGPGGPTTVGSLALHQVYLFESQSQSSHIIARRFRHQVEFRAVHSSAEQDLSP